MPQSQKHWRAPKAELRRRCFSQTSGASFRQMSGEQKEETGEERDRRVLELWERLVEVEQRLIPTGLHVFGRAGGERECADLLRMVASFERPERGARAITDLVSESLGFGAYETLLGEKTEDGWRRRGRVDDVVREVVAVFLSEGVEGACRWLEACARVPPDESRKVFGLL